MRQLRAILVSALVVWLAHALLSGGAGTAGAWNTGGVIINDVVIPRDQVQALEQYYQVRILDGHYWYDRLTGAWGHYGGPAMGLVLPNLPLGGHLRPDASNGNTYVFINGRQLHMQDVYLLQQIIQVAPGRYWCDAMGNVGYEGSPLVLVNLVAAAEAARPRGVRREGILSSYDKTGIAVIGGEVLMKR